MPYLLTVCELGSLSAAARKLGVNHSTVYRRIEGVEARLGVRLFERRSHGYVMTEAGQLFFEKAAPICETLQEIEMELSGQDLRLEGDLTVTTTDSLLHVLGPVFAGFQTAFPDVSLRLVVDTEALNLTRKDADIALRPTNSPPNHWVGREIVPISCATYAATRYWAEHSDIAAEAHRWILLDDDLNRSPMSKLAFARKPEDAKVTVVNTVMGILGAVESGLGLAVLPCYLGDHSVNLTRVDAPTNAADWHLWLLSHPDVRRSARVNAFFSYASKEAKAALLADAR